jgi:hypothetical protein
VIACRATPRHLSGYQVTKKKSLRIMSNCVVRTTVALGQCYAWDAWAVLWPASTPSTNLCCSTRRGVGILCQDSRYVRVRWFQSINHRRLGIVLLIVFDETAVAALPAA